MGAFDKETRPDNPNVANRIRQQIRTRTIGVFREMRAVYDDNLTEIWHNAHGWTPQEVFDLFGKDAGELVRRLMVIQTALGIADSPHSVTVNADGTVKA